MSDQWVDAWLGAARFDRYVAACDGDRARALKLYEWNSELAQALSDLAAEVSLHVGRTSSVARVYSQRP